MKKDLFDLSTSEIHALSDVDLDKAITTIEAQAGAALGLEFGNKDKDYAAHVANSDGGKLMLLLTSFQCEKNRRNWRNN